MTSTIQWLHHLTNAIEIFSDKILNSTQFNRHPRNELITSLKVVLVHILTHDVVRVLLLLIYAVYRLVCSLLLTASLFGPVLVN